MNEERIYGKKFADYLVHKGCELLRTEKARYSSRVKVYIFKKDTNLIKHIIEYCEY